MEDELDLIQVLSVLAVLLEAGEAGYAGILQKIRNGEILELSVPKRLLQELPLDLQAKASFVAQQDVFVLRVQRNLRGDN